MVKREHRCDPNPEGHEYLEECLPKKSEVSKEPFKNMHVLCVLLSGDVFFCVKNNAKCLK